jgi:hypothetical protein
MHLPAPCHCYLSIPSATLIPSAKLVQTSLPSPSLPQSPSMPLPAPLHPQSLPPLQGLVKSLPQSSCPCLHPLPSAIFKAGQTSLPSPSLPQSPSMPMPATICPLNPFRHLQGLFKHSFACLRHLFRNLPQCLCPLPASSIPFRRLQGLVKNSFRPFFHPCLRHLSRNRPQCLCPPTASSIPSATFKAWSKTSFARSSIPALAISPAIALNALARSHAP